MSVQLRFAAPYSRGVAQPGQSFRFGAEMPQVRILPSRPTYCFGWKPRPVLTRLDREERYLDEVPINAALAQLAGGDWLRTSTVSVRIRGAVPILGDAQG